MRASKRQDKGRRVEEQIEASARVFFQANSASRMPLESAETLGGCPPHPHHLGTCPEPGTSAGGNAGIGCGWFGQWGSSADGCRSRPHYIAGCGGRSPGEQTLLIPPSLCLRRSWGSSNPRALVSGISTSTKLPKPPLSYCDPPCGCIPTSGLGPPPPLILTPGSH